MPFADWIAVDWGTSRLRVMAIGGDGALLAQAESEDGMGRLAPGGFEPALLRLVSPWLAANRRTPVLVCGMAGARQGWREAPYRKLPCPPLGAATLVGVPTSDARIAVRIVPGLSQDDPPDVMRGEETQIAGWIAKGGRDGTLCLPGTHSKWVAVADGVVTRFATFLTGETFDLLARQSILRQTVAASGHEPDAFRDGAADALARPAQVPARLFALRAAALLGRLEPVAARSRLSGLLIGAEVAAARAVRGSGAVTVIGAGPLARLYVIALDLDGCRAEAEDGGELVLEGLRGLHRELTR